MQREYQKQWTAQRRLEFFAGKQCQHCGAAENLQLDHIDPEQKTSHKIWTWKKERRDAEAAKCQILCAACHMAKTLAQRRPTQHGQAWMYQGHGCRCKKCRAWKLASSRKHNELRKARKAAL